MLNLINLLCLLFSASTMRLVTFTIYSMTICFLCKPGRRARTGTNRFFSQIRIEIEPLKFDPGERESNLNRNFYKALNLNRN